jgi:PKD repeat protein
MDVFLRTAGAAAMAVLLLGGTLRAVTLPQHFRETILFSGLTSPTAVAFASDGRVFVAEKSGIVKVFDNLTDATPTVFADLRTQVHNYWDRGLVGLALHPNFPATPYVYVLYTHDAAIGGTAPRWGSPGVTSDPCPDPPGGTKDGCVASGRLSRLVASGNVATAEEVLIEDWFIQYTTHSVGSLVFGEDGALYVTGGDGASATFTDYGQKGDPLNPGGDPPVGVGGIQTPPTAEGGALRAQDIRTPDDPVTLDGAIARVDPITGAGLPDNPLSGSSDPNARRMIAHGLRQPFRIAVRPGTDEVWIGDVGKGSWEEINRVADVNDAVVENFGWPCYYGPGGHGSFSSLDLTLCETLYAQSGAVVPPYFAYNHGQKVVAGETCGTGTSAITALAFYQGGDYPNRYNGALFFGDYARNCMWVMLPGTGGAPSPSLIETFAAGAASPVDLKVGPEGDLFYVDIVGGTVRRIEYSRQNEPPTAVIVANPTAGSPPLTVHFDGSGSSDPDQGDRLDFEWDLDGDGQYDDSTDPAPSWEYTAPGSYKAGLRVTDRSAESDTEMVTISVDANAPMATIGTPSAGTTWRVGQVISFSGWATDPQDGTLPASALTWDLVVQHCPAGCHTHLLQSFAGVASGSFTAPDHDYPAFLELRLTARDSTGLTDTQILRLDPQTVALTFNTSPTGLQLNVVGEPVTAPFTATVIIGSVNSISAPSPQTLGSTSYTFSSWSDGGAQSHDITAPAAPATYLATYTTGQTSPSLTISDATVTEGDSGSVNAAFTLTLSASSAQTVSVNWATADGTATAPADYTAGSGTASFPPGSTSQVVSVSVRGDTVDEPNETFRVNLSGAVNATIADSSGTGTILDDDNAAPTVSLTAPANGAGFQAPATVTITANASDPDGTVTQVAFYAGSTLLSTDTASPWSYTWSGVPAGGYSLTARATDDGGATTTSAPVAITVTDPGGGLPPPWVNADVGAVGIAGSASYSAGTFTVRGSGADIWDRADRFHFVYQPLNGDGEIVARVAAVQNTNSWAKAGVMIRESLATNSVNAFMAVTPSRLHFQYRAVTGEVSASTFGGYGTAPYWVKLVRSGSTFTGYKSVDGSAWTPVASASVPMGSTAWIGLAVTSHDNALLNTSLFDSVSLVLGTANQSPTVALTAPPNGASYTAPASITLQATASDSDGSVSRVEFYAGGVLLHTDTAAPFEFAWTGVPAGSYTLTARAVDNQDAMATSAPVSVTVATAGGALPPPWTSQDVGTVGRVGDATFSSGSFTVRGSGADIYGTADAFHFAHQPWTGDGEIFARIVSVQNTDPWAKAGVMIRESLTPGAANAMMLVTPLNGAGFQRRTVTGGSSTTTKVSGITAPVWVRLVRSGNVVTGYRSADGLTWTPVGSATFAMGSTVYVGLAVTSHTNTALSSGVFDGVTVR